MLVAAERVLAKLGAAKLTTNHVAEVAGVSIGTLYQYFPNKQALVAALIERNASQFVDVFTGVLVARPASAPEQVALELGLGLRAAFHGQGKVHLELYDQVPTLGISRALEDALVRMTDQLAGWLAAHPGLDVREPRAMAWVFVRAVEGVVRAFAMSTNLGVPEETVMRQTVAMLIAALPRATTNA